MERLTNQDPKIAKSFAKALNGAPLISLAVLGAATGSLAEQHLNVSTAYAGGGEGDCKIKIETFNPYQNAQTQRVLDRSVPCDSVVNVGVNIQDNKLNRLDIINRNRDDGDNLANTVAVAVLAVATAAGIIASKSRANRRG